MVNVVSWDENTKRQKNTEPKRIRCFLQASLS